VDVVLTTGGTGLTQRDVTPEATVAILEREAPVSRKLFAPGRGALPRAWLSRGREGRGVRRCRDLPGSTGGVTDGLAVLEEFLDHAVDLVTGTNTKHA